MPDPTAVENLERPCGRGLMLMRHYMTEVAVQRRGNAVTMSKVFRNDGKQVGRASGPAVAAQRQQRPAFVPDAHTLTRTVLTAPQFLLADPMT